MSTRNHTVENFYQQALQDPGAIQRNASQYPYCAHASLLQLYHLKKLKDPSFEAALQKSALLFPNIDWLQLVLEPDGDNMAMVQGDSSPNAGPIGKIAVSLEPEAPPPPPSAPAEAGTPTRDEEGDMLHSFNTPLSPKAIEEPNQIPSPLITENMDSQYLRQENPANELPNSPVNDAEGTVETDHEPALVFEPLHTVDYFASIGVKIDEEILKDDKLASQVKSFTEWLKSMKKIHPDQFDTQNTAIEKVVQASADESNVNTEILTEAMAEVLIKQNKKDKAIEMFHKLSLINPAKSAYFAAKIESIKSS